MVAELDKFREKYPDYDDIEDSQLATMLAEKYPESYGDLPGLVQTEGSTPAITPELTPPTEEITPVPSGDLIQDDMGLNQIPIQEELDEMSPFKEWLAAPGKKVYEDYKAGGGTPHQREVWKEAEKRGIIGDKPFDLFPDQEYIKPMSMRKMVSGAIGNAPKSAGQFIKDVVTPFLHPVQTTKALAQLAEGGYEKLFVPGTDQDEKIIDDMIDMMSERYGGVGNIQKTLAEDPVGFVGDLASFLVPGGTAAKAVSKTAKVTKAGEIAAKVGKAIHPAKLPSKAIEATINAVSKGVSKMVPDDLPTKWYNDAVKFNKKLDPEQKKLLAQTALDEKIMPTYAGIQKAQDKVDDINLEIDTMIDKAVGDGKEISVNALFTKMNEMRDELPSKPLPETKEKLMKKIVAETDRANRKIASGKLTPKQVQNIKKGFYQELDNFYDKQKNPYAAEVKAGIAQGAKESLETVFPEIKGLNASESVMIELKQAIEKAAPRVADSKLFTFGSAIKTTAGGAMGGRPLALVMGAMSVFSNPKVKAKLAMVANQLKKQGTPIDPNGMLGKLLEAAPVATEVSRQVGRTEEIYMEGGI
jgi:hypothetical protein